MLKSKHPREMFCINKTPFHVLARAVIIEQEHILLAHEKESPSTFLPGGHVEIGESVITTIERELLEELGLKCIISAYLGALEHSWTRDGLQQFEMNHLFKVTLMSTTPLVNPTSKEDHLEFYWVPIDELENHNVQPYPLCEIIKVKDNIHGAWWGSTLL
ncbi:NUDIX domain-containing protein [Alicyclobacillus fastidiosus]|uniref:NUDIX domain-containing protein n=1 Tax=Alicyclobacillus fastidiosus TaxID=392011 RepID=A0ABV5AL15_9BACL|nr:NUDIX domain-containing protein [Alicyclobacillus fastidiosus]WEH08453.1 NUDIX domain-containing protein [Alicyclobacillus fastidiosus]